MGDGPHMESWHVVGQKVVCIKSSRWSEPGVVDPVEGQIYTIRAIDPPDEFDPSVGLFLKEIVNPKRLYLQGYTETSFVSTSFRPVRTTSIECFRSHLTPTPEQVRETEDA